MSSQRGNPQKTKPPKHANRTAFKNDLHDTNKRTKAIRELQITGCCDKCTKVIEWKIKYKKYKPLTMPRKCVKCQGKTVLNAYYIICAPCGKLKHICGKCGEDLPVSDNATTEISNAKDEQNVSGQHVLDTNTDVDRKSLSDLANGLKTVVVIDGNCGNESNDDEDDEDDEDDNDDDGDDEGEASDGLDSTASND